MRRAEAKLVRAIDEQGDDGRRVAARMGGRAMWVVVLFSLFMPRVIIAAMVVMGDYIGRAYQNDFWAFLGFLFMPYTTLAYAWAINEHGSVSGWPAAVLVLAVLLDLGSNGEGTRSARRRRGRDSD